MLDIYQGADDTAAAIREEHPVRAQDVVRIRPAAPPAPVSVGHAAELQRLIDGRTRSIVYIHNAGQLTKLLQESNTKTDDGEED
jgi:hypothetical protein